MSERPKMLIVDDKIENLIALEKLLADLDVDFVRATSGNEALKKILENEFAIALVDVQMPGMDGFETVEFIRQQKNTPLLPVIFLSAIYKEGYHQIKGIEAGAVDFITKPINPKILIGKVRVFLDLHDKKVFVEEEINRRKLAEKALKESEINLIKINEQLKEKFHELEASEERFRTLVLTIPDIVYRIDKDGLFTFLNDAIKRLGFEPEELIGKHFSEIILPSDVEGVSRSIVLPKYAGKKIGDEDTPKLFDERRLGKRKTTGLEIRMVIKGRKALEPGLLLPIGKETVIVEVNSFGMWGINPAAKKKDFIGTVGVIRDISDRKKSEEVLRNRTAELQKTINLMAGREIRMIELKKVIRKLRGQLESAGLTPVADDPLKEMSEK